MPDLCIPGHLLQTNSYLQQIFCNLTRRFHLNELRGALQPSVTPPPLPSCEQRDPTPPPLTILTSLMNVKSYPRFLEMSTGFISFAYNSTPNFHNYTDKQTAESDITTNRGLSRGVEKRRVCGFRDTVEDD